MKLNSKQLIKTQDEYLVGDYDLACKLVNRDKLKCLTILQNKKLKEELLILRG